MQAHVTSGAELPALGVDIVRVERIAKVMQRHPARFPARVLTDAEQAYVRARPENFAGRWAAKEAVSKVLGLGIRGVGWREIEIERLPTGQPTVCLHGSAAERAAAIGIAAIAVSITHEREYAVAVAYGQRAVREA
jgi:holo-[acyl-carrier protein] synthase